MQQLEIALEPTVRDFYELTGEMPRRNNPWLSDETYLTQWTDYQTRFATVWRNQGNQDPAPLLYGLAGWAGGIENWESARREVTDRTQAEEEDATDDEEGMTDGDEDMADEEEVVVDDEDMTDDDEDMVDDEEDSDD